MAIDPLTIERERIMGTPAPQPIGAGLSRSVAESGQMATQDELGRQFQQLLQAGQEGMNQVHQQLISEGALDEQDVMDPNLPEFQSHDGQLAWSKSIDSAIKMKSAQAVRDKQAEQISSGDVKGAVSTGIKTGAMDVKSALELLKPMQNKEEFSKLAPFLRDSIVTKTMNKSSMQGATPELLDMVNNLTPMVGVSPNIVMGIFGPESSFNTNAQPEIDPETGKRKSTAKGLGQFLDRTGEDMHGKLMEKGLVEGEYNPFNPKKNILYTAQYFAENRDKAESLAKKKNLQLSDEALDDLARIGHRAGPGVMTDVIEKHKGDWRKAEFNLPDGADTESVHRWIEKAKAGAEQTGESFEQQSFSKPGLAELNTKAAELGLSDNPLWESFFDNAYKLTALEQKKGAEKQKSNSKALKNAKTLEELKPGINLLIATAKQLKPGKGISGKLVGLFKKGLGAMGAEGFQTEDSLRRLRKGMAGQIARAVGKETGRFTEQDVQRALIIMPDSPDTDIQLANKIAVLEWFVNGGYKGQSYEDIWSHIETRAVAAGKKPEPKKETTQKKNTTKKRRKATMEDFQ